MLDTCWTDAGQILFDQKFLAFVAIASGHKQSTAQSITQDHSQNTAVRNESPHCTPYPTPYNTRPNLQHFGFQGQKWTRADKEAPLPHGIERDIPPKVVTNRWISMFLTKQNRNSDDRIAIVFTPQPIWAVSRASLANIHFSMFPDAFPETHTAAKFGCFPREINPRKRRRFPFPTTP